MKGDLESRRSTKREQWAVMDCLIKLLENPEAAAVRVKEADVAVDKAQGTIEEAKKRSKEANDAVNKVNGLFAEYELKRKSLEADVKKFDAKSEAHTKDKAASKKSIADSNNALIIREENVSKRESDCATLGESLDVREKSVTAVEHNAEVVRKDAEDRVARLQAALV